MFRELFLAHAPPRLAAVLQEAGRLLYEDLLESGLPAAESTSGQRWVHARVRALARDLRFAGRVLTTLAAEPRQASLDPEELSLAMKGEAWGRELDELARSLEAVLHLEDRELYRNLHAGEKANHSMVGRRADETLERPAPDSALGAGQRIYDWSEEETERAFEEAFAGHRRRSS